MNTVIDPEADDAAAEVLFATQSFRAELTARERHADTTRLLRSVRDWLRLIALVLLCLLALLALTGCRDEQAWAATEADRRRIAEELEATRVVTVDQLDGMRTVVFNRPRTKPETVSKGFAAAAARVNMERVALASAQSKFHAALQSATNPAGAGELPADLKRWQEQVKRARRILLVARVAQDAGEWVPVLDRLVAEELAGTPANFPTPPAPAADAQRVDRARRAFAAFLAEFEGVQP